MKLLNPEVPCPAPRVYPGEPAAVVKLRVDDGEIRLDTNDLSLYLLENGDDEPKGSTGRVQPCFSYVGPPRALVLCVCDDCNLRCDYCYVWDEAHVTASRQAMTERTLVRALDLLGRPTADFSVSFFGGEPTMAWPIVKFGVERAEQIASMCGVRPNFHLTTNGTTITRERAEFLAKHSFGVIVSIDGPEAIHDRHRKAVDGSGSYANVLASIHHLAAVGLGPRVTLRGTFLPGESCEVVERLEHLHELYDSGLGGGVSLEPAALCEMDCAESRGDWPEGEIEQWIDDGTTWCLQRARDGKQVRWAYLVKTVSRLVHRMPSWTECGAGVGYISISPDGEIHACHKRSEKIGHVRWGIDESLRQKWIDGRLIVSDKCSRCWARHLCGGGCRSFNQKLTGDLHEPARLYCRLARAKIRAAVRVLYELRDNPEALARIGGEPCACESCAKPVE